MLFLGVSKPLTIAIDGWSSCGKSTLARQLAQKLGYLYVDSGAMYRAITLYLMRKGVELSDLEAVERCLPRIQLDFTYNVANKMARKFYERHGVTEIEKAFELQWDPGKSRVMTTKYCIKYELERCPKYHPEHRDKKVKEPLVLKQGELEYKLKFNCKPCEMEIWEKDAEFEIEDED